MSSQDISIHPSVHIVVDSLAFSDDVQTHTFESTRSLFDEFSWARIYAGFHFYHSLVDGDELGKKVAHQLLRTQFRSLGDDERESKEREP